MMFQETLDQVVSHLDEAQKTTKYAIVQLDSIGSLTWKSSAGKAFYDRVVELSLQLQGLSGVLVDAEEYLAVAMQEIQSLEAQIMSQRMAS